MKVNAFFHVHELVHRDIFHGDVNSLDYISQWQIDTSEIFRRRYGKTIINDYYWGGDNDSRGTRPPWDEDGADLSLHKYAKALDMVFEEVTPQEVHEDILKNQELFWAIGVKRLEGKDKAPDWTHADRGKTDRSFEIVVF